MGQCRSTGKAEILDCGQKTGRCSPRVSFCEVSVQVIHQYKRRARTVVNQVAATMEVFRGTPITAYPDIKIAITHQVA